VDTAETPRAAADEKGILDWMAFATLLETLPGVLNSQLVKETGQPLLSVYALLHLAHEPSHTAGLSSLAACLSSPLPRMSRITSRLEEEGLVERTTCAGGGRALNVRLTPKGEEAVADLLPAHDRVVRSLVIDTLSGAQLEQLGEISRSLLARLHPESEVPLDRQQTPLMG
jgi:DNA-binding MarR family transcriptional regulator